MRATALLLALAPLASVPALGQLPDGYVDELLLDDLVGPVGITFDTAGRGYLWERRGTVYVVENGQKLDPPLVDIHDEVGNWRDFGMLGFALDPHFLENGYLYLYYVVDRHHLLFAGTPSYDPDANWYFQATIGRIARYTADAATGFTTLVPDSRLVLLGESADSGVPILYESHGTGSLAFGADGTLLASSGDGASYNGTDNGSKSETYWQTALADGIIRPEENVGAFRSQMIGSHSGKILRLDPATGDGLPSNPFYDPAAPRSPRSRTYALGLRNPFRFGVRPGTGNPDPNLGNPGVITIGDVGYNTWEDLHVVLGAGENLGWPLFEGLRWNPPYKDADTENRDAPNPLFGTGGCVQEFFLFQDLIEQEQEDHNPAFKNPCDHGVPIPPGTPTFMHHRPVIDWKHQGAQARVPVFNDDGNARVSYLGDADCPVAGAPFLGHCAVGGVWHSGFGLGDPYAGSYFLMDFANNWMRALVFDGQSALQEVLEFGNLNGPVAAAEDPADGSLLYVSINLEELRRIRYTGGGNVAPSAVLAASADRGPTPLTLRFDGTGSEDPEGGLLTFAWDFGDGATSNEPSPEHVFENPLGGPATSVVTLLVGDPSGGSAATQVPIFLDDTAPRVRITSFADGSSYSTSDPTTLPLDAAVSDAESQPSELSYAWQVFLCHGHHEHPEAPIFDPTSSVVLSPTPCTGEFYAYRVELTVTDPQGLATKVSQWLFPDCQVGTTVAITPPAGRLVPGSDVLLAAGVQGPAETVEFYVENEHVGTSSAPPHEVPWSVPHPAPDRVRLSALALAPSGESASSPGLVAGIAVPAVAWSTIADARDDALELPDQSVVLGGASLPLGDAGLAGLRFALDVPRKAKIVSAHLELIAAEAGADATTLELFAEAADSAAPLQGFPGNLSQRPTTAASASWTLEPWPYALASGARQRSVDLSSVVQEIVDRPGYHKGDALLLLIQGTGNRSAQAFTPALPKGARLVVESVRL